MFFAFMLTNGEIIFEEFQPMWSQSTNVTDGRTDRRHAIAIPRFAQKCIVVNALSAGTVASLRNDLSWWRNATGQLESDSPDEVDPPTDCADDQDDASSRHWGVCWATDRLGVLTPGWLKLWSIVWQRDWRWHGDVYWKVHRAVKTHGALWQKP